ncbi:MAG: cytidine deaminase [Deltaproteobacteria bacterium]|nr:cytidine deaminase [Deltaproteobacteria bacterium]
MSTAVSLSSAEQALVDAAWAVRERAVCSYSGFAVGVALLDDAGRQFTGANVENASYNLGLCAERVALYHALTHGLGRVEQIAVVTEAAVLAYPCGACRQALWEFAPHAQVLVANRQTCARIAVADLVPHAFDGRTLDASAPEPR